MNSIGFRAELQAGTDSALCSLGQWSLVYTLQYNVDTNMSTLYWESQTSTEKIGLIWLTPTALPTSAKPLKALILNYGRDHTERTKPLMHSCSYTAWEVHWRKALDIPFLAFSHLIQLLIIAALINLWWPICSNNAIWNQTLGWLQQATSWSKNDFLAWIKVNSSWSYQTLFTGITI